MERNEKERLEKERLENLKRENLSNENSKLSPEEDPAVINPEELATFPKEKKNEDPDIEEERGSHLANKLKSPVRSGRNITETGPNPDRDGFM